MRFKSRSSLGIYFPQCNIDQLTFNLITVDSSYRIAGMSPEPIGLFLSKIVCKDISFDKAFFYSNCFSYEYDIPTSMFSEKKFYYTPVTYGGSSYKSTYSEQIRTIYDSVQDIKLGSGIINFNFEDFIHTNLNYSERYISVTKELSLYASAVRQSDPFSEFLDYYRILELVTKTNGKCFIKKYLNRLSETDFGKAYVYKPFVNNRAHRRLNLFSIYKNRAKNRVNELKKNRVKIDKYYYDINRCSIAHGRSSSLVNDFSNNAREIFKDIPVIKMLARIAIDNKIKEGTR